MPQWIPDMPKKKHCKSIEKQGSTILKQANRPFTIPIYIGMRSVLETLWCGSVQHGDLAQPRPFVSISGKMQGRVFPGRNQPDEIIVDAGELVGAAGRTDHRPRASLTAGTAAMDMVLVVWPIMATTPSRISSRSVRTAFSLSCSSFLTTSETGLPPMPPASFRSSTAKIAPSRPSMPSSDNRPVRSPKKPIVTGDLSSHPENDKMESDTKTTEKTANRTRFSPVDLAGFVSSGRRVAVFSFLSFNCEELELLGNHDFLALVLGGDHMNGVATDLHGAADLQSVVLAHARVYAGGEVAALLVDQFDIDARRRGIFQHDARRILAKSGVCENAEQK